ncbi:ATP-grasp domain-containing protein [Mycolicibacterium canariasense]
MSRHFRVVTHKNWLAEQFKPWGAIQDFGFDIDPDTAAETIWWAPGAWVASAAAAGVRLPLMSCGPYWLDQLPEKYRGREVQTWWAGDIPGFWEHNPELVEKHPELFFKLPEAKLDSFPATLHGTKHIRSNLAQYHLPVDALVQMQDPVVFVSEWRFWIAHGQVTTGSWYRVDDSIWGSDEWAYADNRDSTYRRAESVAAEVAAEVPAPPGYVIDIGLTVDGRWLVVEANAAWSSGPYDGDPEGIFKSITAAHDFDGQHPKWAWRPNAVLHKAGPLKVRRRQ